MIGIFANVMRTATGMEHPGVSHPAASDARWSGPVHWRQPETPETDPTSLRNVPPSRLRAAR